VKYWEIIALNLKKAGWSLGLGLQRLVATGERAIWIGRYASQRRKAFVVQADELLTVFLELEAAVEPFSASSSL
jgi:hypothetical protein